MKANISIALLGATMALTGCANSSTNEKANSSKPLNMANPAAVYCVEQGGKLETVTENNQRVTYCVFSNTNRTEQWEYFRKNHPEAKNSTKS